MALPEGISFKMAGSLVLAQIPAVKNLSANALLNRLKNLGNLVTASAAEKIARELGGVLPHAGYSTTVLKVEKIIEGLEKVEQGKDPGAEAKIAADEMGLLFAVRFEGESRSSLLGLKREVEELEGFAPCLRLIEITHVIKAHQEVAALNCACEAIDRLMEKNPDLMGDQNIPWAEKDPDTGHYAARAAYESIGEPLPTAILPALNMGTGLTIVGTGKAKGIIWTQSTLNRVVPYALSGMGDYGFHASGNGMLPYGNFTIEQALAKLGFTGPRRPVIEIFAPVPAPAEGAPEAEQFIPRGQIEVRSFEDGLWALITVIEGTAQRDVPMAEKGFVTLIMGDQEFLAGKRQRTLLQFEYVPAMTKAREAETRTSQRGNIIILAIPVVEYTPPTFSFKPKPETVPPIKLKGKPSPSDDQPRDSSPPPRPMLWRGGGSGGGGLGSDYLSGVGLPSLKSGPAVTRGSTHIGKDLETVTGMTFGKGISAKPDIKGNRKPGIIRILPIGISANTPAEALAATVIDLASRKKG